MRLEADGNLEETEAAGQLLPNGVYLCQVQPDFKQVESNRDPSNKGVNWHLLVHEGEHAGRQLWHTTWLGAKSAPFLKAFLDGVGAPYEVANGKTLFDTDDVVGQLVRVKVGTRKGDDGVERQDCKGFMPAPQE